MSAKVVALAGANGYVGKAFANAFLDLNAFQLRILTRASSLGSTVLQDFERRGASLHAISYEDEDNIIKALQGVDVLVSAVAGDAILSAQVPLIKAAKSAGVHLFFPSAYGSDFEDDNPSPVFQAKKQVLKIAKEQGLPTAVLNTGGFPEYCLIPPFGFSFAEKKVTIWGDGNARASWTTISSIASWLVNVLKATPVQQLQNKELNITGDVATFNDIVKLWERKHSDKLQVDYRPLKEIEDRITANPDDFLAILIKGWASGRVEIGTKDNGLYPGWKPDPIESIL